MMLNDTLRQLAEHWRKSEEETLEFYERHLAERIAAPGGLDAGVVSLEPGTSW